MATMPPVQAGPAVQTPSTPPVAVAPPTAVPAPPPDGQNAGTAAPSASSPTPARQTAPAPAAGPQTDDVVVVGRDRRGDPLSGVNRQSYEATQAVDKAVFGPAALTYRRQVPRTVRTGIRNFIWNLREPVVALNFLLQHKIGKAAETVGRFALNTTLGVAGLFDAAKKKPFNLPRRRNSFGNTLGFYGVKPGAFMFLPLIGPTTVRDLVGIVADQTLVPLGPLQPPGGSATGIPIAVLSALDFRAEFDEELEALRAQKRPYVALRSFYLQRRQVEIDALHGKRPYPPPPTESLGMILDPDAAARGGDTPQENAAVAPATDAVVPPVETLAVAPVAPLPPVPSPSPVLPAEEPATDQPPPLPAEPIPPR